MSDDSIFICCCLFFVFKLLLIHKSMSCNWSPHFQVVSLTLIILCGDNVCVCVCERSLEHHLPANYIPPNYKSALGFPLVWALIPLGSGPTCCPVWDPSRSSHMASTAQSGPPWLYAMETKPKEKIKACVLVIASCLSECQRKHTYCIQ